MERQTKTIKLPITGFTVEYYSYITAGEKREVTEILTSSISADMQGQAKGEIALSTVYKANDKAIELLIKSLNGSTENVLSQIKDLPASDYDVLLEAVNAISNDTQYQQKKTI